MEKYENLISKKKEKMVKQHSMGIKVNGILKALEPKASTIFSYFLLARWNGWIH